MQQKIKIGTLANTTNYYMKLFYCTAMACIVASSLFAQEKKLLQNFKYRINNFRAINLNTAASSGIQDYNNFGPAGNKSKSFNGNLGGDLLNFKSTDSKKVTIRLGLLNIYSHSQNKPSSNIHKINSGLSRGSIEATKTWYSKSLFFEVSTLLKGDYYSTNEKNINNLKINSSNNGEFNFNPTVGIGKGRLENITDMQNALWLHKALLSDKNITRPLSENEMNDLGRTITKGNNTRVLDARRRNKFLLKTVDAFLQEKNVIEKTNIDYFNNLNDVLFFAFNNPRLSGKEIYLRINTNLGNKISNQIILEEKNETIVKNQSVQISTGFKKYVPLNLKHQNNYGAAFILSTGIFTNKYKYYTSNNLISETKRNDTVKQAAVELFFEHSIYPNTRTNISFIVNTSFGLQKPTGFIDGFATLNVNTEINYFINYNTRLIGSLGVYYNKNKDYSSFYLNPINRVFWLQSSIGLNISL